MLKLVSLPLVNQIACTRDELVEKLRHVEAGNFVVTIGGKEREGEEVKRLVKPILQRMLRDHIAALNADLREHGVDVT